MERLDPIAIDLINSGLTLDLIALNIAALPLDTTHKKQILTQVAKGLQQEISPELLQILQSTTAI